ncbi:MAG: helix-turn-helix transcriptional regulator [Oscillospiraceae bacterium]|nr:helix-turn-helix transcriptional regulator [Oscillospiraceae bacterium]
MEKISDRIARLIELSGMSKTAFGEKIHVSQSFVSQLCSGVSQPSDRTILDICREFDTSELWLRTGEGEMYVTRSVDEEITDYVSSILGRDDMELQRKIISLMAKLPPEAWGVIVAKAQEVFFSGEEGEKKEEEQTL